MRIVLRTSDNGHVCPRTFFRWERVAGQYRIKTGLRKKKRPGGKSPRTLAGRGHFSSGLRLKATGAISRWSIRRGVFGRRSQLVEHKKMHNRRVRGREDSSGRTYRGVSRVSTLEKQAPWTPFQPIDSLYRRNSRGVHAVHGDSVSIAGVCVCVCAHLTHDSFRFTVDSVDTTTRTANIGGDRASSPRGGVQGGNFSSVDTADTLDTPDGGRWPA